MKTLLLCTVFLATMTFTATAQLNRKEAAENKIKSVSEVETDLRSRKPRSVVETFTAYDAKGNLIEMIERNRLNEIIFHEKYEYDSDGNKIAESQYDPDGVLKKKHVYVFEKGLRVQRKTYNVKGDLIGDKKYIYEFHK